MSGWTIAYSRYRCADCGAPAGDACTDTCPSAIAAELADIENADQANYHEEPHCCPDCDHQPVRPPVAA